MSKEETPLFKTGVRKSFNGHQAWFSIDHQTFGLPESESEDGVTSEEYAKWHEGNLKAALNRLCLNAIKDQPKVDQERLDKWKDQSKKDNPYPFKANQPESSFEENVHNYIEEFKKDNPNYCDKCDKVFIKP